MKKIILSTLILIGMITSAQAVECDNININDLREMEGVKNTRMKASHSLYTSFWRLEIKSKQCKKWTTVHPLDMKVMFGDNPINGSWDEYWVAFFEIAKVEQAVRDQHTLGPRKTRFQEKAHNSVQWMENKENDGSLLGAWLGMDYDPPICVTAGGTTSCLWGSGSNYMVTSN
jgi:hypothetical protein